jgi:hypothetical protein
LAYSASNPPILMSGPAGLVSQGSQSRADGGAQTWLYRSSDSSTAISATTGYFTGQGYGSRTGANSSTPPPVGMRLGDLVCHTESPAGATPGKVTWMSVIASTADQASTLGSSAFNTKYNVTVQ